MQGGWTNALFKVPNAKDIPFELIHVLPSTAREIIPLSTFKKNKYERAGVDLLRRSMQKQGDENSEQDGRTCGVKLRGGRMEVAGGQSYSS